MRTTRHVSSGEKRLTCGDYAPGYIGTKIAYTQGGYEPSVRASRVSPEVEEVLMQAMKKLLEE